MSSEFINEDQESYLLDLINKEFPRLDLGDCQDILCDIVEGFDYSNKDFSKMVNWVHNHVYLYSFDDLIDKFPDDYEDSLKECEGLDDDIYDLNLYDVFRGSVAERNCCMLYKANSVKDCYIYID